MIQHIGAFSVFFVLTKGMSVVGPSPMILAEYDQIQARDCYGQTIFDLA